MLVHTEKMPTTSSSPRQMPDLYVAEISFPLVFHLNANSVVELTVSKSVLLFQGDFS